MSMSSKPEGNESTESQASSVQIAQQEALTGNSASNEKSRRRAYEIYLERGEQPGREWDVAADRGREN
jgi:hypothetical protein